MHNENKPIILAVDDNTTNLKIINEIFRRDYRVRIAVNGEEAIKSVQRESPDLILLDVMMPDMDGFSTFNRLKAISNFDIPVIFLTARNDPQSEERGLMLGAVDYLHKPINQSLAKVRVSNQIELKLLRDNLESMVEVRTKELFKVQYATLFGMAVLSEYRDQETGDHIWRTIEYMRILAHALNRAHPEVLDAFDIDLLAESAALHDIGKVGISDAILRKPGKLTDEEREAMKRHTVLGEEVIQKVEERVGDSKFLRYAKEITIYHHEKWDGSGYPQGLTGEEIPISASLMALVDVYDALTSKRVYKSELSHEEATKIILEGDERTKPEDFSPLVIETYKDAQDKFKEFLLSSTSK